MSDILQELLVLAGIPVTEAEEATVLPNENSLGKRIAPRNNQSVLKNFWNWFADSKIKDSQGRPLVLYHGANYSFTQFEMKGGVDFPRAAYFSSKKTLAKTYGSKIIPVYLKMSNPYVANAEGATFNDFYDQMASDMYYARDNGFDGVIIRNLRDDWGQHSKRGILADTYAVFDSCQIKAIENGGYYDANSENIYEAETPTPQFPNLNLNREKIIPDDDPVKLRNFRNWFGNSTAGWNGQPMVFYHGTQLQRQGSKQAAFNSFDKTKLGKHSHFSSKVGFFFTASKMMAEEFGSHVIPVYLRMIKPKIYSSGPVPSRDTELEQEFYNTHKNIDEYAARAPLEAMRAHTDAYDAFVADIYHRNGAIPFVRNLHNSFEDAVDIRGKEDEFIAKYIASLKSEGYDSIEIRNTVADASKNFGEPTTQYCVFDPEQIKSVDNNGEFSPASSNIYESMESLDFDVGQGIIHKVEMPNIKFLMGEKELMRDQSDYVRLRIASIVKDMMPDLKTAYFTISGKEFYNILVDKLGSPKKASLLLHKYGIKGIRYSGREDGEYAVIFNPEGLCGLKKFYGGNGIGKEKLDG